MDTDALQRALAAVAQQHELLRSRFWREDGKLVQSCDGEAPKLELKPLTKSNSTVQDLILVIRSSASERQLTTASEAWMKGNVAYSPPSPD